MNSYAIIDATLLSNAPYTPSWHVSYSTHMTGPSSVSAHADAFALISVSVAAYMIAAATRGTGVCVPVDESFSDVGSIDVSWSQGWTQPRRMPSAENSCRIERMYPRTPFLDAVYKGPPGTFAHDAEDCELSLNHGKADSTRTHGTDHYQRLE